MKTECSALASKIRETLATRKQLAADQTSLQRQQEEAKKTVDELIAQGGVDDEAAVARVARENGRLLFFPAKLKSIEDNLDKTDKALAVDVLSAQKLLSRAAVFEAKVLTDRVDEMLSPLISDRHRREEVTQRVVQVCDSHQAANLAVTHYYEAQVESAEPNVLIQYATLAASNLEERS